MAVSWSAASVPLPGTAIPTPAQAAAVAVKINEIPKDSRGFQQRFFDVRFFNRTNFFRFKRS
jgi:hypothetical protein